MIRGRSSRLTLGLLPLLALLLAAAGVWASVAEHRADTVGRLKAADRPVLEEGRTTCCYAKSEKSWIADPDGVVWEAFYTDGDATTYGDSPALGTLSDSLADDKCCLPKAAA